MMGHVSEHVRMYYHEIPDSMFVAQPLEDFFFHWDKKKIFFWEFHHILEIESFSKSMIPQTPQLYQIW